ncbi:2-succinyl-6-hydroxy-2,4-cyclohexadiene-1-carboxylate synthase [Xenorhabdus nematophila]|uniref:2-succinyl-6-hydroxy-2, 4-cyclohexadiene-1-carboxylate synthase n=1 Tax=Xenorhabdus nematophila TaxID=628 RepID=UPI00032754AE|nr:2-succinyl-6-hydroxy-2,4-cyclohexadiene-1-carboxylate synthase [Xenorhabdus nematophila]CEE91525.1 putative enzyme with alpha/beta-hydrolase domain [Xenorhabdus nematophila str. Anatoliense]CEF32050.1 putative enzyme with alpha/beta-hydrolase domain [Xenorhabdus nematophila str. Websteri]AYA39845.1 2-succinyl-6-hydroxy-2,4-cyclohexadiene-1-carboxylate synthase [Xenorhabdus nematophila]KHD29028.1 2-succinyl-6-hydroxy-2,4-cyclohexadiene-1-carboxylate synthase [Xenorhabdus nematophila]MCB44255
MPARVTETGSYAVILNCQTLHSHHRGTWLVWLHGFLGKGDDWLPVINACNQYASLIIDLPGHGHSADIAVKGGFAEMSELLNATLSEQQVDDYWLMGYSLGGRIAMYHATHGKHDGLRGLLVEGGNPGLFSRQERAVRLQHDWRWAQRFRQEPIDAVLADWYQQSIFADLTLAQREKLIYLRSQNSGKSVAEMLESTSLGHQPWLIPDLQKITTPFVYLCGENDCKFQRIAEQYSLPLKTLPQVGHNAHYGNPVVFSAVVNHFLSLFG